MGWPAVKMHHLELPELPREAAVFFSELSGGQENQEIKAKDVRPPTIRKLEELAQKALKKALVSLFARPLSQVKPA